MSMCHLIFAQTDTGIRTGRLKQPMLTPWVEHGVKAAGEHYQATRRLSLELRIGADFPEDGGEAARDCARAEVVRFLYAPVLKALNEMELELYRTRYPNDKLLHIIRDLRGTIS